MTFHGLSPLGDTGLRTSRVGLAAGYGADDATVRRAFDGGIRYFYWGSVRLPTFGRAVADLASTHRDEMTVVVQSYARGACFMRGSLERALKKLRVDHADVFLLGWWNRIPPERILEEAVRIREAGLARSLMISGHDRPILANIAKLPAVDSIMVRYNAAHPGAEQEIFPGLDQIAAGGKRRGVVSYTATRWGALIDKAFTPETEPTPTAADCYRFALSNPHVDVCLAGPKGPDELSEALRALDRGPMSADELGWMKRVGAAVRSATSAKPRSRAMRVMDRLFAY